MIVAFFIKFTCILKKILLKENINKLLKNAKKPTLEIESNAFIECNSHLQDDYKNIEEYNINRICGVLMY